MPNVYVVRHGPFHPDPRVVKESLALAEAPGTTVVVLARGPEGERWTRSPRLRVETVIATAPSDSPPLLALQAFWFGLRVLLRLLRAPRVDVVVVHSIPSWLLLLLLPVRLRHRRVRLILDHHEPEAEMLREAGVPGPAARAYGVLESLSIRTADGVVDVSPEMARRTATLRPRRQLVVDNAPQLFVDPDAETRTDRFDLAVFGSLIRRYDLPTLRMALDQTGRPIRILEAGRGPEELVTNPTGGGLERCGYLPPPELQRLLLQCRLGFVGLAPSAFTELVSPNRLWELAALGVPAVVASTPLTRDLLGDAALFYDGGSARSLRDAIEEGVGRTPEQLAAMAAAARERLRHRFWESQRDPFVRFVVGADRVG